METNFLSVVICAGIVTYNPDLSLLNRCIASIKDKVNFIFVVDNGSKSENDIFEIQKDYSNIKVILNRCNRGIAAALNQIAVESNNFGAEWFLTLDQDSVCPSNIIDEYKAYINISDVGMLCPSIKLRIHGGQKLIKKNNTFEDVPTAITSGSLVRVSVWDEVNGFWEYLFIDRVDDDFCYTIRENNYRIIKINNVMMEHEIGQPKQHRFLWIKYYTDSYPDFRYYYIARNSVIVFGIHELCKNNIFLIIFKRFFKIILGENRKYKKVKNFLIGLFDGIRWRMKYDKQNRCE